MQKALSISQQYVYYRIICLWILCEAMLGGVIHALRIPVSGLFVGSAAVICICLIAFTNPNRGAILKATLIVAIFKMLLSPQTPVLAYAAVFFQGLLGEILFYNRRIFRLSCLLLGFLALLESGLQRIIVLTIVYGNSFWKALNEFISGVTGEKSVTNYSWYFISGYVLLHVLAGLLIGWWAGLLPGKISAWQIKFSHVSFDDPDNSHLPGQTKRRRKFRIGAFAIWIVLITVSIQSYFQPKNPTLPPSIIWQILIRSAIIILGWYLIFAPLSSFLLKQWLKKKEQGRKHEIEIVTKLLITTKSLVFQSWKFAAEKKGIRRVLFFIKLVLAKTLVRDDSRAEIFILSGEIQSGKTTALQNFFGGKPKTGGILTPVKNGRRVFHNIQTGDEFPMEAESSETNSLSVGRYHFSRKGFETASNLIRQDTQKFDWVIIDEIGPLELRGEGFHFVLVELLATMNAEQKLLLVVRKTILDKVIKKYQLRNSWVVSSIHELASIVNLQEEVLTV